MAIKIKKINVLEKLFFKYLISEFHCDKKSIETDH